MRAAIAALALAWPLPAFAGPSAADLAEVLKLGEVAAILQQEGADYAASIEADMLPGGGGQLWDETVARLYDPKALTEGLTKAIASEMDAAEIAEAHAFFASSNGQTILDFENAARAAMMDDDVEEAARDTYARLRQTGAPRLDQVDRFVEVNDLLERNVAGALSSNYQFLRGLADGGAITMTDGDIIADVYGQEPQMREDTETWLFAFLLMAYQPLSDEAMDSYIAFSETDGGRALNAALFEGFEDLYRAITYTLGLAAARSMLSSDL